MISPAYVLIVGGGFAGTTLARTLKGRIPPNYQVLLISEESYTTFNPLLPEAVGASVFPEQIVVPIRAMLGRNGGRFIMGVVESVDTEQQRLTCQTLAGHRQFRYEHLVLAFGMRAKLDMLPGMAAYALPLKTAGDAMEIRNVVLRRLARMELEVSDSERCKFGHFIVIGGGFSGVEVAGALVDCLESIQRFYPLVKSDELKITLIQRLDFLLPELPRKAGDAALTSLRQRHVDVRLGTSASEVLSDGVRLRDGTTLTAATVICTIGIQPNTLVERLRLETEGGRILTNPDLSAKGHERVWAIGDCALVPNAYDNLPAPPTAQFAVNEARHLANNLVARMAGRETTAFSCRSAGMMAVVGHLKGVAVVRGIHVSGLSAWLLWRAYYLSQMPTLGRKLRVFGEWFWAIFFPADVTHLRFTRSSELYTTALSRFAREGVTRDIEETEPSGTGESAASS